MCALISFLVLMALTCGLRLLERGEWPIRREPYELTLRPKPGRSVRL